MPGRDHQGPGRGRRARCIADHGAKPNFLGYGGFPGDDLHLGQRRRRPRHPGPRDASSRTATSSPSTRGAIVDGWHGDAASPCFVGSGHAPELVELSPGDRGVDVGRHRRHSARATGWWTSPGPSRRYIRRQPRPAAGKYGIVEDYGGHGIGTEMHMDPHLLNYVDRKRGQGPEAGPRLLPGDRADGDPGHAADRGPRRTSGRSSDDGTWSSHWEHSVALTEEGPLVLTAPDGGRAKLAEYGVRRRRTRSLSPAERGPEARLRVPPSRRERSA